MGKLGPAVVVLVRFPFSDLSASKLGPALVVAEAGQSDWVLCQITSNAYGDPRSVAIPKDSFATGGLMRDRLCSARQTLHGKRGHRCPIGRTAFLEYPSFSRRSHRHAAPRRGPIGGRPTKNCDGRGPRRRPWALAAQFSVSPT